MAHSIRFRRVKPRCANWLGFVALTVAVFCGGGCSSWISSVMINAPNNVKPYVGTILAFPPAQMALGVDQHFRVEVEPADGRHPAVELAVSVIEPSEQPPLGVVLVLHGVGAKSLWMLPSADDLAEAGYRAVLVDLRGHGGSTGRFLTYGVRDAEDLSIVLDELDRRQLLNAPVGACGISYGASTAILLAARDKRIEAVVAVAPFSSMRDEAPHYVRLMLPGLGHFISDSSMQEIVDQAGRFAAFDPDEADVARAISYTKAPVLLVHGSADMIIPSEQSVKLHNAAPDHSRLLLAPLSGHLMVWMDPLGFVSNNARKWFDKHLAGNRNTQNRHRSKPLR